MFGERLRRNVNRGRRKRQIEFSIKTGRKVFGPQTRARPLRDGIRQNLLAASPCRGWDNRETVCRRDSGETHARLVRPANGEPPARLGHRFVSPTLFSRRRHMYNGRRTTVYGLNEPFPVKRFRPRRRHTLDVKGWEVAYWLGFGRAAILIKLKHETVVTPFEHTPHHQVHLLFGTLSVLFQNFNVCEPIYNINDKTITKYDRKVCVNPKI